MHGRPIFKAGDHDNAWIYRPVSLTSDIRKVMEWILKDKVTIDLKLNCAIAKAPYGFRQQQTCLTNLLITAGACSSVPQGSVIGPIHFLLHINDRVDLHVDNVLRFAEDVKLICPLSDSDSLDHSLSISWVRYAKHLASIERSHKLSYYIHLHPGNSHGSLDKQFR